MKRTMAIVLVLLLAGGVFAAMNTEAPAQDRRDYATIHNFSVEIDGVVIGGFREVSGLRCETEVVEYRDGQTNEIIRVPGDTKCGPIVLTYGAGQHADLWQWYQRTVQGEPMRKDGSVVLRDLRNVEVVRYNFYEAFPVKWTGPTLDASSNGIAVEKMEISVDSIAVAYK